MKGLLWAVLVTFLTLMGGRMLANRFFPLAMSDRQSEVLNTQLDVLQEQVAASSSGDGFALLALTASIAVPLCLGVVLLTRAEKTALHSDEIIRQVVRQGLSERLVDSARLLDRPIAKKKLPRLNRSARKRRRLLRLADSDDEDSTDSHESL